MARERCPNCSEYRNSHNLYVTQEDGIFCGKCAKSLGYVWKENQLIKTGGDNA